MYAFLGEVDVPLLRLIELVVAQVFLYALDGPAEGGVCEHLVSYDLELGDLLAAEVECLRRHLRLHVPAHYRRR